LSVKYKKQRVINKVPREKGGGVRKLKVLSEYKVIGVKQGMKSKRWKNKKII